jgi:hypothetical protein
MEEANMIYILDRIRKLLEDNKLFEAQEYVQLEIDNLSGTTPERCKDTKYHFYPTYCKYCSNMNCISNTNKENK